MDLNKAFLLFLFLIFTGCLNNQHVDGKHIEREIKEINVIDFSPSSMEIDIFEKINKERRKVNANALEYDTKLSYVARKYSEKMLNEGFFDHYDKEGKNVDDRLKEANISYSTVGENLALVSIMDKNVEKVIEQWLKSERHRETMLDNQYKKLGVGVACGKELCYITTIYVNNLFSEIELPFKNNDYVIFSLPLNGFAKVKIKLNETAEIILTSRDELEKMKKENLNRPNYYWRKKTDLAVVDMLPDDIIVIYSNKTLKAEAEIIG